jgi:hypothetical protein
MDAIETKCYQAVNRPTIKASASFVGLGVVSTNRYVGGEEKGSDGLDKEWFINTACASYYPFFDKPQTSLI